jgi:hypothetical protein
MTNNTDEFCNDARCERTRKGEKHRIHDITEYDDRQRESFKNLLQLGSQLAGGSIAAILSGAASPEAILIQFAGALFGHSLNLVGNEISQRFLAPREKTRIGAAFIYATRKAQQRLNNGHKIREDDFFSVHPPDRSAAEEIIEGVLIAAQREHEEKKVPYYGYLLANIAFTPTISRVHGNLLIRLGQSLSYNQLCLLAVFALKDKFGLRTGDYRGTGNVSLNILAMLQESYGLASMELINIPNDKVLGLTDINPVKMDLNGEGRLLVNLMDLFSININELEEKAKLLR